MKAKFFSAVLAAMVLSAASVGMTASAEEMTEISTNSEITVASQAEENITSAPESGGIEAEELQQIIDDLANQGTETIPTEPDYYGDDYYDTGGNATLIKEENIIYNSEEMQFIAVTTKDGHVFYVLINYAAENGEDNVFFLNKVDDYDLYALLYAGDESDEESDSITPEQAAQSAEAANGRVRSDSSPNKSENVAEADESNADSENTDENTVQTNAKSTNTNMYLVVGVIALAGVGAAGFFMMKKKKGGKTAVKTEDEFEDETEISEDEEFNFYDNNQDE